MADIIATATVTLTVEIKAHGCWADDTTMRQIHSQARESAINTLNRAFKNDVDLCNIRIVDTPNITSVITDYKK